MTMTVQELMDKLALIKDKSLPVFIFHEDEIYPVDLVDDSISDRVDINAGRG